jgi:hypothetical protein
MASKVRQDKLCRIVICRVIEDKEKEATEVRMVVWLRDELLS